MKSIQAYAVPLAGAAVGGVIGFFLFGWILSTGFYALALPGALVGIGAGVCKNKSFVVAVVCGVAALLLQLFCQFHNFTWPEDSSLGYFVSHIFQMSPITLLMIAAGTAMGFWFAMPRGGWRAADFQSTRS
jgi:hypothetical protein